MIIISYLLNFISKQLFFLFFSSSPKGRWQKTEGHTAACTPCPAGTFMNSEGSQSECTSCPKGYVQPDAAQSDCKECDAGKVQENEKKKNLK